MPNFAERQARGNAQPRPESEPTDRVAREPRGQEPVTSWFDRYLRSKAGATTIKDIAARLRRYALPYLGGYAMGEVTPDVLRGLVSVLDDRVKGASAGAVRERFSAKTARNVWGDVAAAMGEAVNSKRNSLRALRVNPATGVRPPDRAEPRSKPFLYPSELTMLLECRTIAPRRRRCYAVAAYTGVRSSELGALTRADLDFDHQRIHVGKQVHRETRLSVPTKTRRIRDIEIEPAILDLLRFLVERQEGNDGRLVHAPPMEDRAELLRRDLLRAGCTRPALIEPDATRAHAVFHSLRDTCLSHMAVRGDASHLIQWRAGHSTIATTQRYIEGARRYARGFGEPFPPIPDVLLTG